MSRYPRGIKLPIGIYPHKRGAAVAEIGRDPTKGYRCRRRIRMGGFESLPSSRQLISYAVGSRRQHLQIPNQSEQAILQNNHRIVAAFEPLLGDASADAFVRATGPAKATHIDRGSRRCRIIKDNRAR